MTIQPTSTKRKKKWRPLMILAVAIVLVCALFFGQRMLRIIRDARSRALFTWSMGNSAERANLITVQREACPGAPFTLPIDGFVGLLYADPRGPYSMLRRHQGIDIFTDAEPGVVPVYAAYDGYVTRKSTWISTVIQRVPADPLHPERQIWLYYTHMADENGNDFIEPAFDQGASEVFVEQGTLLGYVGNYDGNVPSRIWTHVHFSIIADDGGGNFLNEADVENTYDPTPYLGMQVNYADVSDVQIGCEP